MTRFTPVVAAVAALVGAPRATAADQAFLHIASTAYRGDVKAGGRLAVDVLARTEKCPYAEVVTEGVVRGWNDRAAVLVLLLPTPEPEKCHAMVVTTTNDPTESARVGGVVRSHIGSAADNPKGPTRVAPADGKLPPPPFSLSFKIDERAAIPVLRHFVPAAMIVLEKKGYATNSDGTPLVFGGVKDRPAAALFVGPSTSGQQYKFLCVTAALGAEPADKLAQDVLSQFLKILYD